MAEVAQGSTLHTAGRRLGVSPRTVRRRVRTVCDYAGVNTPVEAAVWAVKRGII